MASIVFTGIVELTKHLESDTQKDAIRTVVKKHGSDLNARMVKKMQQTYVKGYSTGDTAGSVYVNLIDDGMTAEVGPTTNYAPYVELGTRFMEAEPAVKPALEEQAKEFRSDLERLVK